MARGGFQSTKGSNRGFHPCCIFSREFAGQRVWSSGRLSQNSMIIIIMERFLCTRCCSVSVSMCSPWIIDPLEIPRELHSLKRFDDVQDENPDTMRMNLDNVA